MLFKRHNKNKRINWRSVIFYALLIAWPIFQFCVFYIGVNASSIIISFKEYSDAGEFLRWGFGNFAKILTDQSRVQANIEPNLKNLLRGGLMSLLTYAITVIVSIPLGLFFSYYIGTKMPLSGFFRVVLFIPSIIPEIVLVIIYKYFLINAMPEIAPSIGDIISISKATPAQQYIAVMFYTVILTGFGTSVLMYSNAMSKVPTEMIEAAKLDGAKGFTEFWHIILPSVFPTISVFLVTGVSTIFMNQIHLFSFYSYSASNQIQTYGYILYHKSTEIVQMGAVVPGKASVLSAFGLMLSLLAIPITFFVRWVLNRFGPSDK